MSPDIILASLPDAHAIFDWFISHASYLLVFCLMVVESSFVPFPSEVVVPPAVYLACTGIGAGAGMNPFVIVILASLGAMGGAYINYYLSMWVGRPLVYRFADSRLAHACLINREKVDKAERYFDKHGAVSTFIGRLIPAVRQLISIPAGIARMKLWVFSAFTFLGALVWNCILALLGWWLSTVLPNERELYNKLEEYNGYLTLGGAVVAVVCIGVIVYNVLKTNKSNQS